MSVAALKVYETPPANGGDKAQTPAREETQSEYAKLREDNKALREEMRSGFQHIGRVNTAVFVMILALILKDIFLG